MAVTIACRWTLRNRYHRCTERIRDISNQIGHSHCVVDRFFPPRHYHLHPHAPRMGECSSCSGRHSRRKKCIYICMPQLYMIRYHVIDTYVSMSVILCWKETLSLVDYREIGQLIPPTLSFENPGQYGGSTRRTFVVVGVAGNICGGGHLLFVYT
jgi:hypothetical protein